MPARPLIRVLFLDLDGTVRRSKDASGFINKPEDVEVYPEAKEQIGKALWNDWYVCYVSNQGGIAAGFTTHADFTEGVNETNRQLGLVSGAIKLVYCPHAVNANCICRKPRPGMVADILMDQVLPVDVSQCLFVGDRPEDEGCAQACGIPFMWAKDWRKGNYAYKEF